MEKNPHSKRVQRNSSNQCTIMKNLKVNIKRDKYYLAEDSRL